MSSKQFPISDPHQNKAFPLPTSRAAFLGVHGKGHLVARGTRGYTGRALLLQGKHSCEPKNNKAALHLIHCHLASFWQSTKSDKTFFCKIPEKQRRTSVKPSIPSLPGPSEGLKERFLIKWRAISPCDISAGVFRPQMFPLLQKSLHNTALFVIFMETGRGKGMRKRKQERPRAAVSIHWWGTAWKSLSSLHVCSALDLTKGEPGPSIFPSRNQMVIPEGPRWATAFKLAENTVLLQISQTNHLVIIISKQHVAGSLCSQHLHCIEAWR